MTPASATARVQELIDRLGLSPHPEGGFYVESYRSATPVSAATHAGARVASTAIYFLVTAAAPETHLHRLRSDEVFHLYEGGPLEVVRLHADGRADVARLGVDFARGESPQVVIPAGTWFGTLLTEGVSHCLVGCTVAPGFSYEDFELLDDLAELRRLQTQHPTLAARLARMERRQAAGV